MMLGALAGGLLYTAGEFGAYRRPAGSLRGTGYVQTATGEIVPGGPTGKEIVHRVWYFAAAGAAAGFLATCGFAMRDRLGSRPRSVEDQLRRQLPRSGLKRE